VIVLYSSKAFFLSSSHYLTVDYEAGGGIMIEGRKTKNADH
jgi:hypothetical protein